MVSGPRVVLLLTVVVVSLSAAAVPNGAVAAGERSQAVTGGERAQPQTGGDSAVTQTLVVDLQQNGDARWTITKTFNLTSENETEAFRSVADAFEAGETDDLGLASYRRASQLAAESTGRDMQIANISRSTERTGTMTNGTGRLSISFTWTSFGRLAGDRFYIDDVFTTGQGLWFDKLYANQQLIIRPPDGYTVFDAVAPVQSGTIQWTGPEEFTVERLSATFERTGNGGPTTPTPGTPTSGGPTTTGTTTTPDEGGGGSLLWLGLATLGIGAVVVGYLLVRDRDLLEGGGPGEDIGSDPSDGPGTGSGATPPPVDTATEAESDDGDEAIDAELLSDEERVERLLEKNGGRMKQANIVKETNWSNAKVSQLLSSMEEEGQINKLRIGRENLISFPDEDITDIDE
jgi:hypothetical protein